MVGDGGMTTPPANGRPPAVTSSDQAATPGGGRRLSRRTLIGLIAVAVLVIGIAGWYFGYYTRPSVVYSQSLARTGKGYDKLINYVDKQEKSYNQGYEGTGSYKVKFGDFSTDGTFGLKGNSSNSELTFDVGLEATRVNADIRTIKSNGDTPDIYLKAQGVKGLGTVLGMPDLDSKLATIDDSWIVIDHTLIDSLNSIATAQAQAQTSSLKGPTRDQILDEARAFGRVNQQYLFSTAKDKAVTKVVKTYGKETIDGHKTYHYKIALQKDNVKKYIYAQRDALKTTKLNDWLKQNKYDQDVYSAFNDAADSTKDIKSSDTYDIWMDAGTRMVYKVRFSEKENPANNYVDVGLDYKGGDSFPFFLAGKSKFGSDETNYSFVTTINTKSNQTAFKLDVKSTGSDAGTVTANFNLKPSKSAGKISKPANAKPLSQVLSELGLGDWATQLSQVNQGINTKAEDSKREADIQSLQTQLEAYWADNNGHYPSLGEMNDTNWLNANMKSLDQGSLTDPANPSQSRQLAATPAPNVYAYQVTNANGGSCEANPTTCTKYTLSATLQSSTSQTLYQKSNLE
jgi:hypothetical protein